MRPQVEQDDDLIFANRFGVLILSPIENAKALQAEADSEAEAPARTATGVMFAALFSSPFWAFAFWEGFKRGWFLWR